MELLICKFNSAAGSLDPQRAITADGYAARRTLLGRFAAGLHWVYAAFTAAIALAWTASLVEGEIRRLKMLRRTMFGRAGFNLLRARVLHPVRSRNHGT